MSKDKRMSSRTLSRTLMFACICLVVLVSIHCGRGNRLASDNSTVTVLYPWDERVLGPYYDVDAKFLVFLPLFTFDESGQLQGKLAERWEHSPDYRTWTFFLRRDIEWHDGVPFTAHDIKFTLELISRPDVLFDAAWHGMESVSVLDDFTLTITFKIPKDFRDSWLIYYPKHLLKHLNPKEFWSWKYWTQPVGNGPYRYVRHVPNTLIEFEANPGYYRGKPRIERVILKFGGSTPLIELKSGNVDALSFFNRAEIPKLAEDPRFRVYHLLWPGVSWLQVIFWNQRSQFFRDPEVRRALTMAINRRELLRLFNLPEDLLISDVIFTGSQYWRRELPEPLHYDPEMANRLLDEAGWRETKGGGLREKEGQKFRFLAIVPPGGDAGGALKEAAVYIQDQLRRVGVRMDVQVLESNLVRQRTRSGDFQAAFYRFFNHVNGHLGWLGEHSPLGYNNSQVASLLRSVKETADPDEIDQIYRKLMPIISAELPITFLFPQVQTYIVHRRIQGLSSPFRSDPVMNMEHLWIEEED